jgi:hypothetical protein
MRRIRLLALGTIMGAMLMFPAQSMGIVTIGSNLQREPDIVFGCTNCTVVQTTLPADSQAPNGIVSPVNGTVTQWRIRSTSSAHGPTALRIVKPFAGSLFTGAGTSSLVDPPPTSTISSPTQLPIAVGDLIGLNITGANYFVTNPGATRLSFSPPLADGGAGRPADSTFANREITINADIEPTAKLANVKAKARKGGKVRVSLETPNPGTLLAGDKADKGLKAIAAAKKPKLLKRTKSQAPAPAPLSFVVKPTKLAKSLLADGVRPKAKLKLIFTPTGGSPSTQVVKVKLKP